MPNLIKASLNVTVSAFDKALAEKATVVLTPITQQKEKNYDLIKMEYNRLKGAFVASGIIPGLYTVEADARGYEPQQREVNLNSGEHEEMFVLGKKDMPFFYRGDVKVPFEPLPDYLGIVLNETQEIQTQARNAEFQNSSALVLKDIIKKHGLKEVKADENYARNGLYVFQFKAKTSDEEKIKIQEDIKHNDIVFLAAPVLKLLEKNATLLTDNLIVKFKSHILKNEVESIAKEFNLKVLRNIPYAGNAFQFFVNGLVSYRVLDICEALVNTGKVEYAEPDLWHTIELDAITPTDWLFPEQWDHPIINTPDAWQALHDIDVNKTFGDPNVIIALFDTGVDAAHPSFSGNLTDGNPKVYQLFDFANMVANNNSTAGGHGTCTAGAATSKANDASSVAGVNEGTAGIAGNCKLIGVRAGGSESRFSDAYIWVAGFDPHSTIAGFPAPISPGADIISNSIGLGSGSPLSGLLKDTFDYLTTYGRNGKGAIVLFSVGNVTGKLDFGTTNYRPAAAYSKTFAIGATTLNNDGITEGTTSYSNYGNALDFCAPSHDQYMPTGLAVNPLSGARHNPPANYGAFTPARRGTGNVPGKPTTATTLSANANAANGTITVGSIAGMAVSQAILIENPGTAGSEAKTITALNAMTNQITLGSTDIDGVLIPNSAPLFNNHLSGHDVRAATGDYTNCMGGTSYATPVCAGLAALMLSANPNLTWIDVRQIIRTTAIKIDAANNDPVDKWMDTSGNFATDPGYLGPFFSLGYGYGRIDAAAAVAGARDFMSNSDILVRDNLADIGTVPSSGTFWLSPDVWVRQLDPTSDGALAFPANYMSNPPHLDADRSHDNWVYIRMKNTGTTASNNFYVRLYIVHWPGTEFVFPNDFIPTNNPGNPIPTPMARGTYLIGETFISSLVPGESIINIKWDQAKIPPNTVMVSGSPVHWHPCLLVQIAPQDGPLPSGNHVWDSNNLIQRNITIVGVEDDDSLDFAVGMVIGNENNSNRVVDIEIDRGKLPSGIRLYVEVTDAKAMEWIEKNQKQNTEEVIKHHCCELKILDSTDAVISCDGCKTPVDIRLSLSKNSTIQLCNCKDDNKLSGGYSIGNYKGKKVLFLEDSEKVRIPVLRAYNKLIPIIVGGVLQSKPATGDYDIAINQYDHKEIISGSYGIQLKF